MVLLDFKIISETNVSIITLTNRIILKSAIGIINNGAT